MLQHICLSCGQGYDQSIAFGLSAQTLSGYRSVCLHCDQVTATTGSKHCLRCQDIVALSTFPPASGNPDGYGDLCLHCAQQIGEMEQKWCVSCVSIKPITEFSPRKLGIATVSSRCNTCMEAFARRIEKHCIICGQRKPLDAFAHHTNSVDGHRHTCKACLGTETRSHQADDQPSPQSQQSRFPLPSISRFFPEIGSYHAVDWRWWARELLDAPHNSVILDVESTGFTYRDAITEFAAIDLNGTVLINTLINPKQPISSKVSTITGITDTMVADQPMFADLLDELLPILTTRGVLAYNVPFDVRMIASAI